MESERAFTKSALGFINQQAGGFWRPLVKIAIPYRRAFLVVGMLTILGTGAELAEPLIYRMAVNDVAGLFVHQTVVSERGPLGEKPDTTQKHRRGLIAPRTGEQTFITLLWAVLLLFLTNISARFFSLAADKFNANASNMIEEKFILKTYNHVLRLPLNFFSGRASGAVARQIDQSDQISPLISAGTQEMIPEILRLLGIFIIMFMQNVELAIAAMFTLPLYVLISFRMTKKLEANISTYYELWEKVSARIQDALSGIKTLKLSGAEEREVERLKATSDKAYSTYLARVSIENRYLFWQSLLVNIGQALILGIGGWKVWAHRLTPGDVVMFVAYLDRIYDPIDSLTSSATKLQEHITSVARALRLLNKGIEEPVGDTLLAGPGKVEFKDVQFRYVPEHNVLQGLSMTLHPGCVTALVGPSGAGKTTTVDLLMRLYEPNGGSIHIDGQMLSNLDPAAVRREIGVVSADGTVFRGTLADNIRYKRPEATDEEVASATLAAGLGPALDRLPDGLNTEVGEHGVGLSAGERQRLQIARMLVANPRILVFDEATANLDYATESDVKETLNRKLKGKTTLVIAHRYSMVKDADYVYVLDRGKIVEQGNPTDLILAGGWFAQLAQASEGGSEHEVKATGDVIIDYESAGSSAIEDEEDDGEEESDGDA